MNNKEFYLLFILLLYGNQLVVCVEARPISPLVNLEMPSIARFFDGNAICGCSGLGNCRMLKNCINSILRNLPN